MSGIHSVFQFYMIRIRSYLRQYGSSGYETGAVRKRSISAFERHRFHRCTSNIAEDMSVFSLHSTEERFRFATVIPSKSTALQCPMLFFQTTFFTIYQSRAALFKQNRIESVAHFYSVFQFRVTSMQGCTFQTKWKRFSVAFLWRLPF